MQTLKNRPAKTNYETLRGKTVRSEKYGIAK